VVFDLDKKQLDMRVIRKVSETIELPEATAEAAFERVRLRSLGADAELRNAEGGGLSYGEFAKQLGIASRQTIHDYHQDKKIIRWSKGARNFRYPAWQILDHKLLPGLDIVLKILHERHLSPLDIISILLTPMRDLNDNRPLDLLRQGKIDKVVAAINRYGDIGA
jgi:hypothetical protein